MIIKKRQKNKRQNKDRMFGMRHDAEFDKKCEELLPILGLSDKSELVRFAIHQQYRQHVLNLKTLQQS